MFNASFLLYVFITTFTPGPNNIMSMSNAARMGLRKAFPFNLGVLCGFTVVMVLCALFSAGLYALVPKITLPMQIIGAAYMLYLAVKIYHSALTVADEEPHSASFITGALLQFVNVKMIIYGIMAMSTYILPYTSSLPLLACFALGLAVIGFSSTMCWALFGSLFYRLFTRHQRIINTVMALLLVYCAVSLFL